MVKLYEHPLSPYAQKVKLSLYEKGIAFEAITPNIFQPTGEDEFLRSSPRLEVPSLVDGDVTVFDSTIILEYLEDKWPAKPMLPAAPAERARVRMLEEICDTYVEAISWAIAEIRVFGRARDAFADDLLARAAGQIEGVYAWLERQLGGRAFFNGAAYGWGDLSVWPYVAGYSGMGFPAPEGSRVAAWFAQASQREGARKCLEATMQAMSGFQDLGGIVESGLFKREYRDHRLEWMMRSGGARIVLDGLAKGNIRFAVELK